MKEPTLRELKKALREGRLGARELAEESLRNDRLEAYCAVDAEATRRQAEEADAAFRAGRDAGPLQGIPVSVKDLYGVPGYATAAGSPRALPAKFERTGPVVQRLISQGAVITGKTKTVEFAFGGIGTNPHQRTPINPWDAGERRAPGGSTAGGGVSLCEGSAVVALGTDTAGSVRIPASWTGQVALKTTKGRWSTEGIVRLSSTLDTPGVLARSADDLELVAQALEPERWASVAPPALSTLRLGRCDRLLFEGCSPGVVEAVDAAIAELTRAGAALHEVDIPELEPIYELFKRGGPVSAELHHFLASELPSWLDSLDPNVRARLGDAGRMSVHEYLGRLDTMAQLGARVDERLRSFDALLCPTVANTPPRLSEIETTESYAPQNLLCLRNTSIVSYLGLCAVTLPVGLDAEGMPVGLQVIGRAFREPQLLALARTFEQTLGRGEQRLGRPPGLGE
jgi:aspartyl-tRNA(Asn)/glutamyl-tRNA(Gln) amidotransferase subunit A